jgi:hypothetical protein
MSAIADAELLCDSVTALVTPELYILGQAAIEKVKHGIEMAAQYKNMDLWPSVYTAMQVIVNQVTIPHRDEGGCPTHYDLLASTGVHRGVMLDLPELGLLLLYSPGMLVSLCGKLFFHEVHQWEGERICLVHFIKDTVHERLEVPRPAWPQRSNYPI